jgi:hypothetical protein
VGYLIYFNTNSNFTIFWILSTLLTRLLVLKTISRKYSVYHSAGYRSVDFVFALFSSSPLPQYVLVFECVPPTILAVEKQQISHKLRLCLYPKLSNMKGACAILSSGAFLEVQDFSTLCLKRQDIRRKDFEYEILFRISLQRFFQSFLIVRELSEI